MRRYLTNLIQITSKFSLRIFQMSHTMSHKSLIFPAMDDNILPPTIFPAIIGNRVQKNETAENPETSNRGTGAGGSNTNLYGKKFEEKTNNETRLLTQGFEKLSLTKKPKKTYEYYLTKTYEDKTVVFVLQSGLKMYVKNKYNIDLFRYPDEAYIIEYNSGKKVIKILEKKEQNVEGSVETKLWSGPSLKREYELILGTDFEVHYGFCVSDFLKKKMMSSDKKYVILNTIFQENNIAVLFGDDENYFDTLDKWISENPM